MIAAPSMISRLDSINNNYLLSSCPFKINNGILDTRTQKKKNSHQIKKYKSSQLPIIKTHLKNL